MKSIASNSATLKATTLNIVASLNEHQLISKKRLFEKYCSCDTNLLIPILFMHTNFQLCMTYSELFGKTGSRQQMHKQTNSALFFKLRLKNNVLRRKTINYDVSL